MKEQTNTKRRKLYLILALFCLIGAFVGLIDKNVFMALVYVILAVLFFVLWVKKPLTIKKDPPAPIVIGSSSTLAHKTNNNFEFNASKTPYKTEKFHVTGTSHYQKNIESLGHENYAFELSKKELIEEGYEDDKIYSYNFYPSKVELIEEPDNPYDPNAIKVVIDNILVGYIKKGSCSHVKKLLHSGKIKKIDAEIYGGKYKVLYSEYDDEKEEKVYDIEKDSSDYYVTLEIKSEE